jgi:tryptophan-rich sensory protein
MELLNQPLFHISVPILLSIILNGLIFIFKIRMYESESVKKSVIKLPPGYVIGTIWVILLGTLGYAHYLLYKLKDKLNFECYFLEIFILFCLSYPFVTQFKEWASRLMNFISLIFGFSLALVVMHTSLSIFWYIVPLLLWLSYVNLFTIMT